MLNQELMNVLFKNYSIPQAKGRYVDMGMSFKSEVKGIKHMHTKRRERYKPGELRVKVLEVLTTKWTSPKDLAPLVLAAVESTRSSLDDLTEMGMVECNGIKGMKQYRLPRGNKHATEQGS